MPGLGNELAWEVQRAILPTGELPIIEVFNRQDWPGKKEEFHTGNFGALAFARQAGYDLVLVGFLYPPRSYDELTADVKLIEVESGTTVYFSRSQAANAAHDSWVNWIERQTGILERRPELNFTNELVADLAGCISADLLSQTPVPE